MTRSAQLLSVALIAAATPLLTPAPPAQAGSFGFTITPKDKDAAALRTGLELYSAVRSIRKGNANRASTNQRGQDNRAGISQQGTNNRAHVFQRGRGNTGTISQNGNNNAFALVQLGRRNSSHVTQNGNGNAGIRFEWGW